MVDINTTRAVSKKLKQPLPNEETLVRFTIHRRRKCFEHPNPREKNPGQIPTDETAPIPEGGINPQGVPNTASGSPDTDIPHQGFIEVVKPDTVRPPDEKTRILNSAIEAQAKGDDLLAGILFDALAKMSNPNLHKVTKTLGQLSAEATIPDGLDHDGDLTYATTGTTHNFVGFTPYLDENIRKL
ncbi:hypothetical protein H4Q26_000560 [Puccinia striiformis f. sp. tritici PST-130]|nr:hypothetical protein H4Q26_000560 [Puccinia striiformis f. sp. tritici PST-130]